MVDNILNLVDDIAKAHRKQVDVMMTSVKEEVKLLHAIENGEDIDSWVGALERILDTKAQAIGELKEKLAGFKRELAQEEKLSESWRQK